jgi:hypothetical protein
MSHEENRTLLQMLSECVAECNHCAVACLQETDVKTLERCIRLDLDCSEICQLTAGYVARGSELLNRLLEECAEICNICADECAKHGHHMEHCKRCAEVCRRCAEACSQPVRL